MFGNKRSIEGSGDYRADIVEIDWSVIGQTEHDALKCSWSERHPYEITPDDAVCLRNRVSKCAPVVVGKIYGYFSKLHWWLRCQLLSDEWIMTIICAI